MNTTRNILICFFLLTINYCKAQSPNINWAFVVDGYNDVSLSNIALDNNGNTYAAINYMSALEIPELKLKLPTADHVHGLLLKIDKDGKAVWARAFKSPFDNRINNVAMAPNGDVLITGFGDGPLLFPGTKDTLKEGIPQNDDPFHRGELHQGFYAARYTPDGDRRWVQYWNSPWAEGISIAANNKDQVYIAFYYRTSIEQNGKTIDSTPVALRNIVYYENCMAALDANGKIKSVRLLGYGSSGETFNEQIRFDHDNNMLFFGTFHGKIQLTPTDSLVIDWYQSTDSYLAKFDPHNKLLWVKTIGGRNLQQITDIAIAADNSIYATGKYTYECIVGDGIKVEQKSMYEWKSGDSFFYLHLFSDGELDFIHYEKNKKYMGYFFGLGIAVDQNEGVHIVGQFTDTMKMNGQQISGPKYSTYSSFYSYWQRDTAKQLSKLGVAPAGCIFGQRFVITNNLFAGGAFCDGDNAGINVNGKKQVFSNKNYGHVTFIFGGKVNLDSAVKEKEKPQKIRAERIEAIKPLLTCTKDELSASNLWFPTTDSIPVREKWLTQSPCGTEVSNMQALLYPNPTQGTVNIKLTGIKDAIDIEVLTVNGQLLLTQHLEEIKDGQIVTLNLSKLLAGTYFVHIINKKFEKAFKVVKL